MEDREIFCWVCDRPTDHRGEHDGLLALGLVRDTTDGTEVTDLGRQAGREVVLKLKGMGF